MRRNGGTQEEQTEQALTCNGHSWGWPLRVQVPPGQPTDFELTESMAAPPVVQSVTPQPCHPHRLTAGNTQRSSRPQLCGLQHPVMAPHPAGLTLLLAHWDSGFVSSEHCEHRR